MKNNELFLVIWTDVFFFHIDNVCPCYPHVQLHRARIKKETFVFYLIYNNVIIVAAGPKLGVFVDDLQGSGHHVLCLLGAARRLPEHGVEEREAEGESWCRQWSYVLEKKDNTKKQDSSQCPSTTSSKFKSQFVGYGFFCIKNIIFLILSLLAIFHS